MPPNESYGLGCQFKKHMHENVCMGLNIKAFINNDGIYSIDTELYFFCVEIYIE